MPRFAAIEGARAWLAWAVVFSHIAQTVGIDIHGGHLVWLERGGEAAVQVFIAISGFVITGLVIDKREPWPRYIVRRAFRLFPAYWVAYAAGVAMLPFGLAAVSSLSWSADPLYVFDDKILGGWTQAIASHPAAQFVLHALLLQGVVPDSVWPYTSGAGLGPAWSLTLEWQFYLFAPVMVWLLANPRTRIAAVVGIMLLAIAFEGGLFGVYWLKSFLPGAGYIFLVGIACRLGFDRLKAAPVGPEIVLGVLLFGFIAKDVLWFSLWFALAFYLAKADQWRAAYGAGGALAKAMDRLLASPMARYLGDRSYSVYLIHLPVIFGASWLITRRMQPDPVTLFLLLVAIVIPVVLLLSEVTYRLVERPMIGLGARLAAARTRAHAE